jgi:hypothetical protein
MQLVVLSEVISYNLAMAIYLETLDLNTIIILSLIVVIGLLAAEIFRLNGRFRKVLLGKNGENLEGSIETLTKGMENLDSRSEEMENYIIKMDNRLRQSIQKVQTIRFNPFKDQGGNQSFATCFLDENGNGVIISSLYSRDKVSVYAKPVVKYQSEFELSDEEKEALKKAK